MDIVIKNIYYVPNTSDKNDQKTPHSQSLPICLRQILYPHKTSQIVKKRALYDWLATINPILHSSTHFYSTYGIYIVRDNL